MANIEKIRVLVVSYLPWRDDTNVGNTLSNLFSGMQDDVEFASIYFKGGKPQNSIASSCFYIPEKQLAKSIITRKPVGSLIDSGRANESEENNDNNLYNKARQMRWESMLLAQDCIGLFGVWKSPELDRFIEEFKPDVVFGPLGRVPVSNLLMRYIHDKFGVPVIAYAWDDHYSLKKSSLSLFFWIKTFLERKYIRRCAEGSEYLYTITEPMRQEYEGYFNKECRILYKCYEFKGYAPVKEKVDNPVKIIYMGNIGSNRWKVIGKVAGALERVNAKEKKAELFVYTMSPISEKMKKAIEIDGVSSIMKPVSNDKILETMQSADILLHVEPTNKKDRQFFRLSFSTKIVDYLYNARCIFAIGGDTAAMDYLKRYDAAVVELDEDKIYERLNELISDKAAIVDYGRKAWICGERNHQKASIQNELLSSFRRAAKREEA